MITEKDLAILRHIDKFGFLTINQCYNLYFNHAKYGKDLARKELVKLEDMNLIKRGKVKNHITNEMVFYKDKLPSSHRIILMDFYSELQKEGVEIKEFEIEKKIENVRSDAFIKCQLNDYELYAFVEVVITNQVDFKKYEELKEKNILQEKIGMFPMIIVIGENILKYRGNKINVKYLNYRIQNVLKEIFF